MTRKLFAVAVCLLLLFWSGICAAQIDVVDASLVRDVSLEALVPLPEIAPRISVEYASVIDDYAIVYPADPVSAAEDVSNRIEVEYASVITDILLEYPGDVIASAGNTSSRIEVEYASVITDIHLSYPGDVLEAAQKVPPRIGVEYATVITDFALSYPEEVLQVAEDVKPRIYVEYATVITDIGVIPPAIGFFGSVSSHWYNWATTFPQFNDITSRFEFVRDGAWWDALEPTDHTTAEQWGSASWTYPYNIQITNCSQTITYDSGYDELVQKFQSPKSPDLLLLLDIHNPNLAADPNNITYDQFYDYVQHVVERYDGDGIDDMPGLVRPVTHFEIGNEVDSPQHNYGLSQENYVLKRLIPAYLAAKDANPNAIVLNAGLALGGDTAFDTTYIESMLNLIQTNDGEQHNFYMDKLAIHYYYDPQNPEYFYQNVNQIKAIMASHNLELKPIWVTEYGIATKNDAGGQIREDDQASVLVRESSLMDAVGIERAFVYNLKDLDSNDPGNWENVYGLYRVTCENGTERPTEKKAITSLQVFREKTRGLNFFSLNPVSERNNGIYRLIYGNAARKIEILWYTAMDRTGINPDHASESTTITADIGANTGVLTDMEGNILDLQVTDKTNIVVGEQPKYLEINCYYQDRDLDNIPDAWESSHGLNPDDHADASLDPDDDGLTNLQEYQNSTDPHNPDTDNDSMSDGWEILHGFDPNSNDASLDPDGDGLSNLQEYQHGTDPQLKDTDGDGMNDGDEVAFGSDPTVADAIRLGVQNKNVLVSLQGDNQLLVEIENTHGIGKEVDLSLSGLDPSWYTITEPNRHFYLIPFEYKVLHIQLHLPLDCGLVTGETSFTVAADWVARDLLGNVEGAGTVSDSASLTVTPDPNVYHLVDPHDQVLAGNTIVAAWRTDVPTTSYFYYREAGSDDFVQVEAGTDALEHRVMIEDLKYFTFYEVYSENQSACGGLTTSDVQVIKTGKAVKFVDSINEFWIDRDYNQPVTMTITNTDLLPHTYQLTVEHEYQDIVVGFVGDGSPGREATLEPGESREVELYVHAQDAEKTLYEFYLKVVSDEGETYSFVDYSQAVVHVRPFVANLDIQPVESEPGMMTSRFRLMNYGDTLADIAVTVDEDSYPAVRINPAINHYRLAQGEFVEFELSASEYVAGSVFARSGNYETSHSFEIGCAPDTELQTYTVENVSVIAEIKDWYCTNKQTLELPFSVPSGIRPENISASWLEVNFSLPMAYEKYDPHTVKIYMNGNEIAAPELEETIPEGKYVFRFPSSMIHLAREGRARNILTIEVEGMNSGQYIVATDFKIYLNVDEMNVDLCVPPPPPPSPLTPPVPRTSILSKPCKRKFRPGALAPIKFKLVNDDSTNNPYQGVHDGILTVTITNDSYQGDIQPVTITRNISVSPSVLPDSTDFPDDFSDQIDPADYTLEIPSYADDIEYTIDVSFENTTMNQVVNKRLPGFWVRTPLIIVHGVMGSVLVDENTKKTLWSPWKLFLNECDDAVDKLVCDQNGCSSNATVKATEVIKRKLPGISFLGDTFYGLEKYLSYRPKKSFGQGYVFHDNGASDKHPFVNNPVVSSGDLPEDAFYFVYDWRLDNAENADKLKLFIKHVIAEVKRVEGSDHIPNQKVNLLVHSMGGLVTKSMLQKDPAFKDQIKNVFFLGTPHLGSVDTFSLLHDGLENPLIDNRIDIDAIQQRNTQIVNGLARVKSSMSSITDAALLNALSAFIDVAELSLSEDNCFDYAKHLNHIWSLLQLATNFPSGLVDVLVDLNEYYTNDMDINFIKDSQAKKMAQYMPSGYQLLPSAEYFNKNQGGYYKYNNTVFPTIGSMDAEIESVSGDSSLWTNAKEFHLHLDNDETYLPEKTYMILGCKVPTTNMIEHQVNSDPKTNILIFHEGDGDGTVPIESAWDLNVRTFTAEHVKHSNLPSYRGTELLVRSILKGYEDDYAESPFYPIKEVTGNDPDTCNCCGLDAGVRIVITPPPGIGFGDFDFKWPKVNLVGGGTWSGDTGNAVHLGIIGSDYHFSNRGIEIFIPEGAVYTLEFDGIDREYLNIKYEFMRDGGVIRTSVFYDVPIDVDGVGNVDLDLTDLDNDPVMRLDNDGDGTFDVVDIAPTYTLSGTTVADYQPPVTTAQITGTSNGGDGYLPGASVTLSAADEVGGSGVLATNYQINAGDTSAYSGPIQFDESGIYHLTFWSLDQNLNQETAQTIQLVIDDGPPRWTHTMVWDNPSTGLARNSTIGFELSEDIDAASVNNQSIVVTGEVNGQYPGTVSYDPQTRVVLFTPDDKYFYQDVLAITLRGDVADSVGLTLDGNENNISEGSPQDDVVVDNVVVGKSDGLQVSIADIDLSNCPQLSAWVMVTGSDGQPITDLVKNNFTLLDNFQFIEIQNVAFVEQNDATISVSLAMDYSGSMGSAGIADMENAADTFVQYLEVGDQAEIIKFAQGVEVVQSFTSDQMLLHDAVFLQPGISSSSTSLYDAIVQAVNDTALVPVGQKAVIVLTDGNDNSSTSTFDEALIAAQDAVIPVFAIGLGGGVNTNLLTQLAQQSGGMYFAAPTSDDLQEIYNRIAFVLQNQYVIDFSSLVPDGHERRLQVVAEQNDFGGSDSIFYQGCGCLADIDNDLDVDGMDLQMLQKAYGFADPDPDYDARCDFNKDGIIDMMDIEIFLGSFGRFCH